MKGLAHLLIADEKFENIFVDEPCQDPDIPQITIRMKKTRRVRESERIGQVLFFDDVNRQDLLAKFCVDKVISFTIEFDNKKLRVDVKSTVGMHRNLTELLKLEYINVEQTTEQRHDEKQVIDLYREYIRRSQRFRQLVQMLVRKQDSVYT